VQIVFDPGPAAMIGRAEMLDGGEVRAPVVTPSGLITMRERAAADPPGRPRKALRDRADIALLGGDVPDPPEGR
jgi:hypothetical protein